MSQHAHIIPPFVLTADDDIVTAFEVREGTEKRSPHYIFDCDQEILSRRYFKKHLPLQS